MRVEDCYTCDVERGAQRAAIAADLVEDCFTPAIGEPTTAQTLYTQILYLEMTFYTVNSWISNEFSCSKSIGWTQFRLVN